LVSNKDGATLVYVPEGIFLMGSNYEPPPESAPTYYDFRPQRPVTLNAFWIDQTEVTNKQYAMCVSAGDCVLLLLLRSPLRSSYYGDPQYDDHPVIYVDWFMAKAYCEWAGRRLPTEAEWEKAARGTDGRIYPWGNDAPNDTLLNFNNYWTDTTVIRQYPAGKSPYGAYDMAGNVWEWTSSLYMPYPYDATDGREGLSATRERVLRGGSWYFEEGNSISIFRAGVAPALFLVRSDTRGWLIPSFSSASNLPYGVGTLGFRCAMSATP
jgi:serine/threonine-protein kinase